MENTTSAVQKLQGATLAQFFSTLSVSMIVAAIEIAAFVIIRTRFKRIYEPKIYIGDDEKRIQPLPRSLFGWLPALLRMPQEDLIRVSGLDAYFFARYLYIHAFFFLSSFVLLGVILIPVYVVGGKGESEGKRGLDLLTFGNISFHHSSRYIAPLVLAYVFIGAFLYILSVEMKVFIEKRQAYLRSPAYLSHASATTILVTEIPEPYMSHDVLFRIFDQLPGGVKKIWLNRNFKDLLDKADERKTLVETFESTLCKQIKASLKDKAKHQKKGNTKAHSPVNEEGTTTDTVAPMERPTIRVGPIPYLSSLLLGKKVDAISYCTENISKLNTEIERAKANLDDYTLMNCAFIQFNKQIAAHIAVQSVTASVPLAMTPRYIDVKPKNIIWSNLKLSTFELKIRKLIVLAATTALIVFWTIPVSFIGTLSSASYLEKTFPFLTVIHESSDVLWGLITGLLPTVLLSILMALLPIILRLFAAKSGIPTTDRVDHYVQGSYFIFQVVHVFLFVSISSSVTSVIRRIFDEPSSAASILATNIPTASNFFLSYLALQGLSVAGGVLVQISSLILFYVLEKILVNTPRKKYERRFTLDILSWGIIFPVFTNFIVITLVYAIIAPLILLISGIAFALYYIVYTYVMFYVTISSANNGLTFPTAIYQSFAGIYLMEIMLAGLFFLAQNADGSQSSVVEGTLMCVLMGITVAVHYMMKKTFDPLTYYLPIDTEEFSQTDALVSKQLPFEKPILKVMNFPITTDTTQAERDTTAATTTIDLHDDTMENVYMHPVIRDPKPVVWIAHDDLGHAAAIIRQTETSGMDILMSSEGARFNEEGNIEIDGAPPDHVEWLE